MPTVCWVPNCTSVYKRKKVARANDENILKKPSFFTVKPKTEEMLEKWRKAIPRADRVFQFNNSVCEKHFAPDEILWYYETVMPDGIVDRIERERPSLVAGAVPTIFPPKYLSKNIKKRKPPKQRSFSVLKARKTDSKSTASNNSTSTEAKDTSTSSTNTPASPAQADHNVNTTAVHQAHLNNASTNRTQDFRKYFNNQESSSDLIINVNGKIFPGHKFVLVACSPYFEAMFADGRDTLENKQNCIYIKDIDEKVFEEMLRYMYTGKVENLETMALDLAIAADKYNIERLKTLCEEQIYKAITVETAPKILILSESYNLFNVKKNTIAFICGYLEEVKNSENWNLLNDHPKLFKDLLKHYTELIKGIKSLADILDSKLARITEATDGLISSIKM